MNNRILLISPDAAIAQTVKSALQSAASLLQVDGLTGSDAQIQDKFQPQGIIVDSDGRGGVQASFERIAGAKRQFPGVPVIAMGNEMSAQLVLAAMRAGADDFVDRDVTPDELQAVVRARLLKNAQAFSGSRSQLAAVLSGLASDQDQDFALNLAVRGASRNRDLLTLYLDLSLPATQAGVALNLNFKFGVQDAIREIARLDRALLEGALARCPKSGLYDMPLAADGGQASGLDAAEFSALLQILQSVFDAIVIGYGPFSRQLALLEMLPAQTIFFAACNQRFSSVKAAGEIWRDFAKSKFAAPPHLVVHATAPQATPNAKDIRAALGAADSIDLEAGWDELAESLNEAAPLGLKGSSLYARGLDRCLAKMGLAPEPKEQNLKSTLLSWMRFETPKVQAS